MTPQLSDTLVKYLGRLDIAIVICGSPANVRYLTGYHNWLDPLLLSYMTQPGGTAEPQPVFAAATPGGRTGLVVQRTFLPNVSPRSVDVVVPYGEFSCGAGPMNHPAGVAVLASESDPVAAVRALIGALVDHPCAVAADRASRTPGKIGVIEGAARPFEVRDASATVLLARAVKTSAEVDTLRESAAISEQAVLSALSEARPGDTLSSMRRAFRRGLADHDADFDHLAVGLSGIGISMDVDYEFADGLTTYVDFGGFHRGYVSDSGLTVSVGQPSGGAARAYEVARSTIELGSDSLRAGTPSSEVRRVMQAAVVAHGFGDAFPHGHGIGLQLRDYPILVEATGLPIADDYVSVSSDLELASNNVINLELAIFDRQWGSVQVEQSFVIASDGAPPSPLTVQSRALPIVLSEGSAPS